MINYTGEECLICKEKFSDSDDVVVCPECGTPYHRSCYKEKNGCVNQALHESGGSWMADNMKKKNTEDTKRKICPDCAFLNPESAEKCSNCGTDLSQRECKTLDLADKNVVRIELDADRDYYGMNPMEVMDNSDGITLGEMADYVKSNKLYYMLMFRRLKNSSVRISVNLLAFLFPELFCAGRKMYMVTAILIIARFFLQIPASFEAILLSPELGLPLAVTDFITSHQFSEQFTNIMNSADIAVRIMFGLAANDIYYRHVISRLKKIKKQIPDYLRYRRTIKYSGGISVPAVIVAILAEGVLLGLLMLFLVVKIYLF